MNLNIKGNFGFSGKQFAFTLITIIALFSLCVSCMAQGIRSDVVLAKQIIENRKIYKDEVQSAMKDCLTNSNNNRDVVYNDSNEVVESCMKYAKETYGVSSPWGESRLIYLANKEIK